MVDRWLQQVVSQQLASYFELDCEAESYGFRPQKNTQKAVRQNLKHINDGYQDIVDIDLRGFFDEVQHYKFPQLICQKVKCPITLWLTRKWLRAPILIKGRLHKRRKGVPQGSPLRTKVQQFVKPKTRCIVHHVDPVVLTRRQFTLPREISVTTKWRLRSHRNACQRS